MYNVIGSFGVYTDKELGEKSFYQFKDMYSMFLEYQEKRAMIIAYLNSKMEK